MVFLGDSTSLPKYRTPEPVHQLKRLHGLLKTETTTNMPSPILNRLWKSVFHRKCFARYLAPLAYSTTVFSPWKSQHELSARQGRTWHQCRVHLQALCFYESSSTEQEGSAVWNIELFPVLKQPVMKTCTHKMITPSAAQKSLLWQNESDDTSKDLSACVRQK